MSEIFHDRPVEGTSATRTAHIGTINGDTRIRNWPDAPSGVLARIIADDNPPTTLEFTAPDLFVISDDAQIWLAPGMALAIDTINGDCTADHITSPLLIEHINGDLLLNQIKNRVAIKSAAGDVVAGDLTHLTTDSVDGDLRVQNIGLLEIGEIGGDAVLNEIEQVFIDSIGGDVVAVEIQSAFSISSVGGDAHLRTIQCHAILPQIGGDLSAQDLADGISTTVSGMAYLETALKAEAEYEATGAEIVFRVRSPINAQFVAQCNGGGEIRTHLPLTVERHRQHLVGVIGQGGAIVTLKTTSGDILLDAAGSETSSQKRDDFSEQARHEKHHHHHRDRDDFGRHNRHDKHGFRVGVNMHDGHVEVHDFGEMFSDLGEMFQFWPFTGEFNMSNPNKAPRDPQELEQRLRDLGDRTGRAARKAAEKFREYSDRVAARARDTDWDAVSREIRTAVERTVSELETTFHEIMAEFQAPAPTNGAGQSGTTNQAGATAQRVPIDMDEEPVGAFASESASTDKPADEDKRAAARRAILEQLRSGTLTLEEADSRLREL
jgi:hypothetical protein